MTKLYMAPPFWIGIGYLTGWVHFRPGVISATVYAFALFGMVVWIMRDLNGQKM